MEATVVALGIIGILIAFINLPGQWLVFIGAFMAYLTEGSGVGGWLLLAYFALAVIASVTDNLFMLWGTKKYGGSWWGVLGAFIGLIVGALVGSLLGAIVGPFIGAYLFESSLGKKDSDTAFKAGIGTILGLAGGVIVKVIITAFMFATLLAVIN